MPPTRSAASRKIPHDPSHHVVYPQSQLHSVDDAPPPVSHPQLTILPNLNVDTDDDNDSLSDPAADVRTEDDDDADHDDHADDDLDHPDDALDVSFVLEHRPRRKSAQQRMQRPKGKAKPFAGVDSLLKNLSQAQRRAQSPDSASHHRDDRETSPVVKRRRRARSSPSATAAKPLLSSEIHPRRFDALMDITSEASEKFRFRRMFRSVSGRQQLFRIAESRIVSSHHDDDSDGDDELATPPRKVRRLIKQSKTRRVARSESANSEAEMEAEQVEDPSAGDDIPLTRAARRRTAEKQGIAKASASVPLPKRNSTLINRLNGRTPFRQQKVSRPMRSSKKSRSTATAEAKGKGAGKAARGTLRVGTRRSNRTRATKAKYEEEMEPEEVHASESDMEVDFSVGSEEEEEDDEENVEVVTDSGSEQESVDEESELEAEEPEPSGVKRRRKSTTKNQRRKRTRPRSVFDAGDTELTVRKRRERLDLLVKQSAEIARDLHRVMAEATNAHPPSSTKTPGRRAKPIGVGEVAEGNPPDQKSFEKQDETAAGGNAGAVRREEVFVYPNGKGRELQPHQTDGVKWLLTLDAQGLNAILADEMGLGKTVQAVAFLASLVLSGSRGPHLVIAPKNVCEHWAEEVRAWYPGKINVVTHLGGAEKRLVELEAILEEDNFDILVTSYEVALRDLLTRKRLEGGMVIYRRVLRAFRKVEFEYVVVDEAHRLKNDRSMLNRGIHQYQQAQRRLLLTGTPLSNKLQELWSLLNVLNPNIFSSKQTFEDWFAAPFASGKGAKVRLTHSEQSVIVDRLHTILRPFFRRRVRADVCPAYTSADEVVVRCPMSQLQKAVMLHFRRRADSKQDSVNNLIMSMRMVSSHPYTLSDALISRGDNQSNPRLISSSGKFTFLHYSLPRLFASGHRVLIFTQFRRTLDFLEDLMDLLDVKYGRLDGETASESRLTTIAAFNAPESELKVFLLTTRAGGIGINLQTADTVILFDSDWNPSADLQAVSRIQRIGQKKTVHIVRLLTEMSADEHIYEVTRKKLRTQAVAVAAGKFNTSLGAALDQSVRQKDLEQLLQKLDINKFMPAGFSADSAPAIDSEGSPGLVQQSREQHEARKAYEGKWNKALLRQGETSLSETQHKSVWIDARDENGPPMIPVWLGKDANLSAARRALNSHDPTTADYVYEETLQSIMREGVYSKKDRAARACRNIIQDFGSAFDSASDGSAQSDSSKDPSAYTIELEDSLSSGEDYASESRNENLPGTANGEVGPGGESLNASKSEANGPQQVCPSHEGNRALTTEYCVYSALDNSDAKRVIRNLPKEAIQYALLTKSLPSQVALGSLSNSHVASSHKCLHGGTLINNESGNLQRQPQEHPSSRMLHQQRPSNHFASTTHNQCTSVSYQNAVLRTNNSCAVSQRQNLSPAASNPTSKVLNPILFHETKSFLQGNMHLNAVTQEPFHPSRVNCTRKNAQGSAGQNATKFSSEKGPSTIPSPKTPSQSTELVMEPTLAEKATQPRKILSAGMSSAAAPSNNTSNAPSKCNQILQGAGTLDTNVPTKPKVVEMPRTVPIEPPLGNKSSSRMPQGERSNVKSISPDTRPLQSKVSRLAAGAVQAVSLQKHDQPMPTTPAEIATKVQQYHPKRPRASVRFKELGVTVKHGLRALSTNKPESKSSGGSVPELPLVTTATTAELRISSQQGGALSATARASAHFEHRASGQSSVGEKAVLHSSEQMRTTPSVLKAPQQITCRSSGGSLRDAANSNGGKQTVHKKINTTVATPPARGKVFPKLKDCVTTNQQRIGSSPSDPAVPNGQVCKSKSIYLVANGHPALQVGGVRPIAPRDSLPKVEQNHVGHTGACKQASEKGKFLKAKSGLKPASNASQTGKAAKKLSAQPTPLKNGGRQGMATFHTSVRRRDPTSMSPDDSTGLFTSSMSNASVPQTTSPSLKKKSEFVELISDEMELSSNQFTSSLKPKKQISTLSSRPCRSSSANGRKATGKCAEVIDLTETIDLTGDNDGE